MNPTLTLVVPTYNERENLIPLVQKITAALEPTPYRAEILIVDDNSPDGTAQVAESLDPRYGVRVLRRSGKLGLSSAVIAGWKEAKGRRPISLWGVATRPGEGWLIGPGLGALLPG